MANPWTAFKNAPSETKMFWFTVALLGAIVLGMSFFAYMRLPQSRSAETEQTAP